MKKSTRRVCGSEIIYFFVAMVSPGVCLYLLGALLFAYRGDFIGEERKASERGHHGWARAPDF